MAKNDEGVDLMSTNIVGRLSNSISVKLAVIAFLLLILQIPAAYVGSLIQERKSLQYEAENKVTQAWGGLQHIGAPILEVEYQVKKHIDNKDTVVTRVNKILAEQFNLDIKVDAEKRYFGIYELPVFVSQLKLTGSIILDADMHIDGHSHWSVKRLFIPIKEMRGLKKVNYLNVNNVPRKRSKQQEPYMGLNGFWIDVSSLEQAQTVNFDIGLVLAGSRRLNILPLAGQSDVRMQSNWPSPSFKGSFLPETRVIEDTGFQAKWSVNELNHGLGRVLEQNKKYELESMGAFGVEILIPANIYQVNERTVKYSLLVMLLTFAGFFLAEMFFKLRLHPFQYLLIGFSLSVFYLLLLSLSEYLYFDWAFVLSSLSTVVLISGYCMVVLGNKRRGLSTAGIFLLLYGFIFVLVKAEQLSLLMGAIGIWMFLAAVMYLTRKIDWYNINQTTEENKKEAA